MTNERMFGALLLLILVWFSATCTPAQSPAPTGLEQSGGGRAERASSSACAGDARKEAMALQVLLRSVRRQITSVAEAMPADKYSFQPTEGEFKGVRTFGQQVKHLAATNEILAAAALGEPAPAEAGDEAGPENVRTKAEILAYLSASFSYLDRAIDALGHSEIRVKASPISPLNQSAVTRESLIVEAVVHAFDHYGQMVEYLRMNGVVPPASLP
jgi:uncharacterized damage-inducible protein DinB